MKVPPGKLVSDWPPRHHNIICKEMYDQHTAIFAPGLSVFHKKNGKNTYYPMKYLYISCKNIFWSEYMATFE